MPLDVRYEKVFRKECGYLSLMVVGSLQKLVKNSGDIKELEKMVQNSDTIIGDARFLEDKELEDAANMVVKTFSDGITEDRFDYSAALEQFERLVVKNSGTCPIGYKLVGHSCMSD